MRPALASLLVAAGLVPPHACRRAEIEAAFDTVHRFIAYLDALDGDPDLEGEEPEASAWDWCGSDAQRFDVEAAA